MGADTNAQDADGNSVLCVLAQQHPVNNELVAFMLNHGAHIDIANKDHLSAFKFLKKSPVVYTGQNFPALRCLAAQTVRQFNVPYRLSERLEKFINLH
jgi:hypothetical protein